MKICEFRNCERAVEEGKKNYCSDTCRNREAVKRSGEKLKRMSLEYRGGACGCCGYNRTPEAIDFHHIDPNEKDFSISAARTAHSWDRVKEEVEKCIPLCSVCHREHHAGYISQEQILEIFESINKANYPNPKTSLEIKICPECNREFKEGIEICRSCSIKGRERIEWPDDKTLLALVVETSLTEASVTLGVSQAAIYKRMKKNGIQLPKHFFQQKQKEEKKERTLLAEKRSEIFEEKREMVKKEKRKLKKKCDDCDALVTVGCARCVACYCLAKTTSYPPLEELIELVKNNPMNKVGEMFGVSGNAIKKHLKRNGFELPKYHTQKELIRA